MHIQFCGAAGEVTGSCHYVEAGGLKLLLDCGLFQGGDDRHQKNCEPFPFDVAALDYVLLSHAHIDHAGRLPLLHKLGYNGPILGTKPSVELAEVLLLDSAHLQEEDAKWKKKRLQKKGEEAEWVKPLYTIEEAEACLDQLQGVDYEETVRLKDGVSVRYLDAGHILGSSILELTVKENGAEKRLVFSGDLGVRGAPILRDPTLVERADFLLMESTYGDRLHENADNKCELLRLAVKDTIKRGGKLLMPAFAVGRTQEILYELNSLFEDNAVPRVPVFVDSPMAISATKILLQHPEVYDAETNALIAGGEKPFQFPEVRMVQSVDESKELHHLRKPCIIIAGSGMCTGGRIKHHLHNNIDNPVNTILFVGYQGVGTLGRSIREGAQSVRIFGQQHAVRAEVRHIDGFSAHADRDGLIEWFAGIRDKPQETCFVHGDPEAAAALSATIAEKFKVATRVPARLDTVEVA
ncbi:MAG: MBL fold metallo-hydrolase [Armatimonadetes bacterium]|nr:MBL fold metallo-hydrolase [Armatimonadota bacterium]